MLVIHINSTDPILVTPLFLKMFLSNVFMSKTICPNLKKKKTMTKMMTEPAMRRRQTRKRREKITTRMRMRMRMTIIRTRVN